MAKSASAEQARINIGFIAAIVCVATIGGFMFGYDSGRHQRHAERAGHRPFALDKLGVGVNVGAILVGSAIGAFGAGRLADLIGRRSTMMLAAILFLISALLAGAAMLLGAIHHRARHRRPGRRRGQRHLAGLYLRSGRPPISAGRLSSVQQVMIITGLTGAFVANFALARFAGGSTRASLAGFPRPGAGCSGCRPFPPPSISSPCSSFPRARATSSSRAATPRRTRCSPACSATRGKRRARSPRIRDSLAADHHKPKLSDLIDKTSGKIRPIVWTGIGLAVFQQFVGINVVFYYGATLWEAVGFSEDYALQTNILSGVGSPSAPAC